MPARPCLNIVWSSASRTLIFLVGSGALSIPYHYPSATAPLGSIAPFLAIEHLPTLYSPECVERLYEKGWRASEVQVLMAKNSEKGISLCLLVVSWSLL